MKSLYLLRHGKSDWDAEFVRDLDRPLAKRGRNDATRMGAFFAITANKLDQIVSSPAVRARHTAERFLSACGLDLPLTLDERLYEGDEDDLLDVVRDLSNDAGAVMLVGHQPTWSEAASMLIGDGDLRFPTAGLARIDLHIDAWEDADEDTGELIWFVIPRLLKPVMKRIQ